MGLTVQPNTEQWTDAVRAFNLRLRGAGGDETQLPLSHVPDWLPRKSETSSLYQEYFVVTDGVTVRGGYKLRHQQFRVGSEEPVSVAGFGAPVSEGIVDKKYAFVGVYMLKSALARNPLLYSLGMGGRDRPFPRLLNAAGWQLSEVPFYFSVLRPSRFIRNISHLRRTRFRRLLFDGAAFTGIGEIAFCLARRVMDKHRADRRNLEIEVVDRFSAWADDLWDVARNEYSLVSVRSEKALNTLYDVADPRFTRLLVRGRGKIVGWALVMNNQLKDHSHFGSMRLGSIVDCLARPGEEHKVVTMATQYLEGARADLIVTNQNHRSWCDALRSCGYLSGPSNFVLASSPALCKRIDPYHRNRSSIHMTRGEGDGPINL